VVVLERKSHRASDSKEWEEFEGLESWGKLGEVVQARCPLRRNDDAEVLQVLRKEVQEAIHDCIAPHRVTL